jgi:hypothetical protein
MLFMMRSVESLWFYPEAFTVLVLQKGYAIARSAVVPTTIASDAELVEANSKLSLISGLMSFLGAAPAALLFKIGGPSWSLALASFTFLVATMLSVRIHSRPVAIVRADANERAELRGVGVLLAASAMGLIRGIVGFLTLLLAFDFRRHGVPKWHFALVAGVSVGGSLLGAVVAPRLRKVTTEERMIIGVLVVLVLAAFTSFGLGGVTGGAILGLAVGVGAVTAKLAFDSIVQRDAPDANRGRSFAKFETRFQLIWVIGALIGLIDMPARVGFLIIMLVAAFAAASYGIGSLAWKHRTGTLTPATERAVEIEDRINEGKAAARREFVRGVRASRARAAAALAARRGQTPPAAEADVAPEPAEGAPAISSAADSLPPEVHAWPDEPPSVDPLLAAQPSFGPKVFDQETAPIVPPPEPVTQPLPEPDDEPVGTGHPEQPVTEDTPRWRD